MGDFGHSSCLPLSCASFFFFCSIVSRIPVRLTKFLYCHAIVLVCFWSSSSPFFCVLSSWARLCTLIILPVSVFVQLIKDFFFCDSCVPCVLHLSPAYQYQVVTVWTGHKINSADPKQIGIALSAQGPKIYMHETQLSSINRGVKDLKDGQEESQALVSSQIRRDNSTMSSLTWEPHLHWFFQLRLRWLQNQHGPPMNGPKDHTHFPRHYEQDIQSHQLEKPPRLSCSFDSVTAK